MRRTPVPMMLTKVFDKKFLPKPLSRKPIKGSSGIRNTYLLISIVK
jgi:hypothetical protein